MPCSEEQGSEKKYLVKGNIEVVSNNPNKMIKIFLFLYLKIDYVQLWIFFKSNLRITATVV